MAPNALGDEPSYAACFHWLDANCVMSGGGVGWGYPFNWQSRVFIPRGTPTVVNSSIIGDAYWLRYKTQGAGADLARCEEICRFILGGLNRSYSKDGTFCFSYTPIDHLEVHNANLLGAEFLIRIGIETNRQEWVNTGLQAARFSLGQIQEDGTLSYWSNAQSTAVLQQDTYHAGFEIRALHRIAQATDLEEFRTAADSYFAVWRRDYFAADGAPCFQRKSQGVVEVHSLAEALLCASEMHAGKRFTDQEFVNLIGAAFQAGTRALWISEGPGLGYFARIQQRRYGIVIRTDIPFLRWGEAWMAAAMAAALERTQKVAKGEGTVVEKA